MNSVNREFVDLDQSPIDIVEDLAEMRRWDVDRLAEDQIAMAVEGAWRTYSLSLAWYDPDEVLRMVCTYEMDVPKDRLPIVYEAIENANDRLWCGGFNLWKDQGLMVYRYGLSLRGGAPATFEQVDAMLHGAVENCERFYPAFQLVAFDEDATVESAMQGALLEAAGRA